MRKRIIVLCFTLICISGCIGGGTHGYIKAYRYAVPKYELEKAVRQVIVNNPNVYQDTVKDYYNDDTGYVTVFIKEKGTYEYTFRYYGGKEYWDTSRGSEIFIAYAWDEKRRGGSEGGRIKEHGAKFIHDLIQPFEKEFVLKIDSILGMKHTEQ